MASDREALATFFAEQGLSAGNSLHSWRCEYPDRYGECECVASMINDLLASDWLAAYTRKVREETKAGIAGAIARSCPHHPADDDSGHCVSGCARIAREWEPEVGTDG